MLAYRVAKGATWGDSPDITATCVPFPNVNLPPSPPVFTLQVTPLQKLPRPAYSLEEALVSQDGEPQSYSAALHCSPVSVMNNPFLLPSSTVIPRTEVSLCDFHESRRIYEINTPCSEQQHLGHSR